MAKKPKIIILMHYMELGGAETALLGLLYSLNPEKVDVDLFVYDHRGVFFSLIPTDKINILQMMEEYSMLERPIVEVIKKGYYKIALMRMIGKVEGIVTGSNEIVTQPKWVSKVLPNIGDEDKEYDLAISFLTPHYFVLDHVKAKKKVGWIHTDYTKIDVNPKVEQEMWERLDNVVSISPDVTRTFLEVFTTLRDKIVEIENILSVEIVRQRAEDYDVDFNHEAKDNTSLTSSDFMEWNLLSIGRINHQKNFDNIPFIAAKMREMGLKFHWYIIGPGNHEDIDKTIDKLSLKEWITFLGPYTNPYPYIKACDVYIQPSRYEGKSVTVREAQILCKPIVVTNYPTAPSQIKDGVDGVIVPMDNEGCARGIFDFLNDKQMQKRIVEYLESHDYGNESEVEKVYELCRS